MSTPQEFQRVSAELTQLRAAVAALCARAEKAAGGEGSPFPAIVDAAALRAALDAS